MYQNAADELKQIIATDQDSLEIIILKLAEVKAGRTPADKKSFQYYGNWLKSGRHLSGKFITQARILTIGYVDEVLCIMAEAAKDKGRESFESFVRMLKKLRKRLSTPPRERRGRKAIRLFDPVETYLFHRQR